MKVVGDGPIPARLMIVGEAPGEREDNLGKPFIGASGDELGRMLAEAGIMRSEVFLTNVSRYRPPNNDLDFFLAGSKRAVTSVHTLVRDRWVTKEIVDGITELKQEIAMVKPNLILALGNLALWALTGKWAITKWRGSQLRSDIVKCNIIPTIHPAAVLRQWELRAIVLNDLRRAKRHMQGATYTNLPTWRFIVRPTFEAVKKELLDLLVHMAGLDREVWLDFDIETKHGHIDCFSISWSRSDAICVPLFGRDSKAGYWTEGEEAQIIYWTYQILTHRNARVRTQNGLYDSQYTHKWWHFIPRHGQDTMISQHSVFCAQPKGLGFLGSMYADHYVYWKDEGKISSSEAEEVRWRYNCQDCVYTREIGEVLQGVVTKMSLTEVEATQQRLFYPVLKAMLRGVRIRQDIRKQMSLDIQEELSSREAFLYSLLGHSINVASPKQMQALFYEDLKQKPVLKRNSYGAMRPTVDDEALTQIASREPLLKPITNAIADIRTLNKFLGDFVLMPLDDDERMRCSFNIAGDANGKSAPYSYRLSSGKNAFGNGGNLQTIPSEKSKSTGKAAARGSMEFTLPNIRSMYGPDAGFDFFDLDLDRADLQVVAWEADDATLKAALRLGADIHLLNAYAITGKNPPPVEELVEAHPKYWDHRGPMKHIREFAKVFCHATDYLGKSRTVAAHTGRTIHEIDVAQKLYFGRYPGIQKWQNRVIEHVKKYRFVENRFGYKWHIFNRIDDQLMPQAVAWIPQSSVGAVINRIWLAFDEHLPKVQTLLQVHDSLAGQVPSHLKDELLPQMRERARIVIPYDEPLIIPVGIKTSPISWGDCQ